MMDNRHHMGGFGGTAAWLVIFIVLFILLGGPLLRGFAAVVNSLPGSTSGDIVQ